MREIATTLDDYVYTSDDDVIEGDVVEGKRYKEADFNKIIEIKAREKKRVEIFMYEINQREKTIVFCANQIHALAVRDLINQTKTISNHADYCVRVTADDGEKGETHLSNFKDNEKTLPTILTTSQKLSTGVDARNVRNIVLMRTVNSIIEFKQIIGRGTRLYDDKYYFTIYDFVKAYEHFEDAEWDGEPVAVEPPPEKEPNEKREQHSDDMTDTASEKDAKTKPTKLLIKLADGKERVIQHIATTTFWDAGGKPMSATQFMTRLFGDVPDLFKDEDQLRAIWGNPDTRKQLLLQLAEKGYGEEQLEGMSHLINAEHSDLFDVLAYVAYSQEPITRQMRVETRKASILSRYKDKQQEFIDFVLSQYVQEGVKELAGEKLADLLHLKYHALQDATEMLGDLSVIRKLFVEFQHHLYQR